MASESSGQNNEQLIDACRDGDLEKVRTLLDSGADVNFTTENGYFPLDEASRDGHLEIVRLLIQKGASVNKSTQYGFPLKEASRENHQGIVRALLDAGANIFQTDSESALEEACKNGHLAIVVELIKGGAHVNLPTEFTFPLKEASRKGHVDIVKELIEKGADVNLKTDHESALEAASRHGQEKVVTVLLNAKADVNSQSGASFPLREAVRKGHLDVATKLLEKGANLKLIPDQKNLIHDAIDIGHIGMVRELLKWAPDPKDDAIIKYCHTQITELAQEDDAKYNCLARMYKIYEVLTGKSKEDMKTKMEDDSKSASESKQELYSKCKDYYITKLAEKEIGKEKSEEEIAKEAMKSGEEPDYHIRVNFVGHLGAGKTSLMLQMLLEKFNPEEIESTNGLEISTKNCFIDIESMKWYSETELVDDEKNRLHRLKMIMTAPQPSTAQKKINETKEYRNAEYSEPEKMETMSKLQVDENYTTSTASKELQRQPKTKRKDIEKSKTFGKFETVVPQRQEIIFSNTSVSDYQFMQFLRELKELKSGRKPMQAFVRGFDYAGQCIFYTVHQLFLSQRGINIIVLDGSRSLDEYVEDDDCRQMGGKISNRTPREFFRFWAMTLRYSLEDKNVNRIIAVITHKDKVKNPKDALPKMQFEIQTMIKDMKMTDLFVKEIFCINSNNKNDSELEKLRNRILELSKNDNKNWGKKMPSRWLLLEDLLMKKKSKGERIMKLKDVFKLNEKNSLKLESEAEILVFLKKHHELGTILHYADDGLKDLVILDPQWVIDSLKCIITAERFWAADFVDDFKNLHETGILNKNLMQAIWKHKNEKGDRFFEFRSELEILMEKLDLISAPRTYDKFGNMITSPYFVVPCMLQPVDKSFLQGYRTQSVSKNIPLIFQFHDKFLPPATVYRLIAACNMQYGLKEHKTLFCDAAAFEVFKDHFLILEYKNFSIIADVVSYTEQVDVGICQGVREFLDETLKAIIAPQKAYMKYTLYVACRATDSEHDGMVEWEKLFKEPLDPCKMHKKEAPHPIAQEIKQHWMILTRKRKASFSKRKHDDVDEEIPSHLFLGRLSRIMPGKEHVFIFLRLGLHQTTIDNMRFNCDKQDVLQVRLLLNWLKNSENPTYKTLVEACQESGFKFNIKDIEEQLTTHWREDLPETSLSKSLCKATDVDLNGIATNVGARYLHFGLELGFKEEDIDRFYIESKTCLDTTHRIIKEWIEICGEQATWKFVGDALYEIEAGVSFIQAKFATKKNI